MLNLSFHARTALIALKDPKSFTQLVVDIVMIFILLNLSDGSMIARLNTSSPTRNDHSSAIADHITVTGHNIKWDHFEIIASGKTYYHCSEIKETLFIQDLN